VLNGTESTVLWVRYQHLPACFHGGHVFINTAYAAHVIWCTNMATQALVDRNAMGKWHNRTGSVRWLYSVFAVETCHSSNYIYYSNIALQNIEGCFPTQVHSSLLKSRAARQYPQGAMSHSPALPQAPRLHNGLWGIPLTQTSWGVMGGSLLLDPSWTSQHSMHQRMPICTLV